MPSNPYGLLRRDIHVWRFDLTIALPRDLNEYIDEPDWLRADRFAFARDRAKFLRARYVMRKMLGRYLDTNPKKMRLLANEFGKPFLPVEYGISFNLSHAGNHGLLAIGTGVEIGVDIEKLRTPSNLRDLANSVFSVEELRTISDVPDDALSTPFFTCWTRKEAYLKALGTGLTIEPRSVSVGVAPVRRRVDVAGIAGAKFVDVTTIVQDDCYFASLAVVGGFSTHRLFDLEGDRAVCH